MVTTCARISVMTGSQPALRRIVGHACPKWKGAALWWNDAAKLDAKNKQPRFYCTWPVSLLPWDAPLLAYPGTTPGR